MTPKIAPDVLQVIRDGVRDGRTYSEMAADLGMTRSRIAGYVQRHAGDVARPEGTATRRYRVIRPVKLKRVKPPEPPKPPRVAMAKPVPIEPMTIECVVIPFTVAEGCRWPLWNVGDPLESKAVCGTKCDGPYCAGHSRLAHRAERRAA